MTTTLGATLGAGAARCFLPPAADLLRVMRDTRDMSIQAAAKRPQLIEAFDLKHDAISVNRHVNHAGIVSALAFLTPRPIFSLSVAMWLTVTSCPVTYNPTG